MTHATGTVDALTTRSSQVAAAFAPVDLAAYRAKRLASLQSTESLVAAQKAETDAAELLFDTPAGRFSQYYVTDEEVLAELQPGELA